MPYRSDEEAVRSRKQELELELVEAKKRAQEVGYLDYRVRELEEQISALSAQQDNLKKARLPLLSNSRVASPCSAEWSAMVGDDYVRLCKSCNKNVYNLSSLSAEAAEKLLREKEGEMCVLYFTRGDGTILTEDCPVGVRKKRVRRAALAATLVGGAAAAGAGYVSHVRSERRAAADAVTVRGEAVTAAPLSSDPDASPSSDPFLEARDAGPVPPPRVVYVDGEIRRPPRRFIGLIMRPEKPEDSPSSSGWRKR